MTTATSTSPATAPPINSGDRLTFTLFLAIALHAMLILGLSFELSRGHNETPVIEVTLAHHPSEQAPDKADFMAQNNQEGGGTLEEKALPTVKQAAEFVEQQFQEEAQQAQPTPVSAPKPAPSKQVVTLSDSQHQVLQEPLPDSQQEALQDIDQELSLLERSLQLASLDAKLDFHNRFDTKKSRVKEINSASTLRTSDAYYTKQWLEKIQRIGKQNYPSVAKRRKIFGSLRLTVVVQPDGEVSDIRVLRSSGHKVLDDAALRIVRLAAPFAPFPDNLKRDYDRLEITRTWLFSPDGQVPVLRGN